VTAVVTRSQPTDSYFELVLELPLRPIHDDEALDNAVAMIDRLLDRRDLTAGEQDYLDVLSDLVERYEDEHIPLPVVRGVEMLRYLMDENNLKQADLVPIFGTKSIVSEVLSEKRSLALSHIQGLSAHFGLPADVFMNEHS
jgi:HTH-type transcriptional regulator/antitoxin HigA